MTALLLCGGAFAGPWVKAPGQWYAKAAYGQFRSDSYVDGTGELVEGASYVGRSLVLYGETGLGAGFEGLASVPWHLARQTDGSGRSYQRAGVGDVEVGLGRGVVDGVPLALHVSAKLPAYGDAELAAFGTEAGRFPALGDGQVDLVGDLAFGGGGALGEVPWWGEAALGYVRRTGWTLSQAFEPAGDFGDGLDYALKLGLLPGFGWATVGASGRRTFVDDGLTRAWHQADASLAVDVAEGLAVELSGGWVYAARASAKGASAFAGLSHRR